jgi:hypothetical protein
VIFVNFLLQAVEFAGDASKRAKASTGAYRLSDAEKDTFTEDFSNSYVLKFNHQKVCFYKPPWVLCGCMAMNGSPKYCVPLASIAQQRFLLDT